MKNSYTVRIFVNDREKVADLLDIIEPYGPVEIEVFNPSKATIDLTMKQPVPAPEPTSKAKAKKTAKPLARKRTSKVNSAIFNRLIQGEATVAELKSALESAGMSAASLSTGIAALTKEGMIERIGDGLYRAPHQAEREAKVAAQ